MKTSIRLALFLLLTVFSSILFAFPDDLSALAAPSLPSDAGYHPIDCPDCHHHHHDYPYDHHHRDLPYGSYKRSCYHCYVDGSVLSCVCDDRNQFPQNTSLNLYHCYRHNLDVINDDGQLVCGREVTEQNALNEINLFLNIR